MNHADHAWCHRAVLLTGIFFVCFGASAQDNNNQLRREIQSPHPVSTSPSTKYKFDSSSKINFVANVKIIDGGLESTVAPATPDSDGVRRLTLEQAKARPSSFSEQSAGPTLPTK
jgi:hypothetical protein